MFEAETDLASVLECHRSHCSVNSLPLAFVPATQFRLLSGEAARRSITSTRNSSSFSPVGIAAWSLAYRQDPAIGAATVAVNVRTLVGVDVVVLTRLPFNGKDL